MPRDVDRAQTPNNYAFHLPGTSMFGAGNTYIYAHARVGMFLSLWNARVGDVVTVRTPNGTREYLVAEIHPRVPPTEISWTRPTADTRLTLQTSTGPNGTDPRFVVIARPPAALAPSGYQIEIPRLGISLPIAEGDVPRDVERAETPDHYAFHLPGTSMFGPGNTYIYAHARVGMFLNLWNVRVGDVVTVRTPNGTREYVVAEVHPRVPPNETSWARPTQDTRLTLQTSTGGSDTDPRFVVVARPR